MQSNLTQAQLEYAARRHCQFLGIDPDAWAPGGLFKKWQIIVDFILEHEAMTNAIAEAKLRFPSGH